MGDMADHLTLSTFQGAKSYFAARSVESIDFAPIYPLTTYLRCLTTGSGQKGVYMSRAAIFTALLFAHMSALAIKISGTEERVALFRDAVVWTQPAWLSDSFEFSDQFDIFYGPLQSGNLSLLNGRQNLHCITNQEDQDFGQTGMTRKFYCQLMKQDESTGEFLPLHTPAGKRERLKVKYTSDEDENPEVYGEVLGTRLMWALGFGSDHMYPIENLHCFGCTEDPFSDRRVDSTTLKKPRHFQRTAIEVKLPGKEIKFRNPKSEGWRFEDLMDHLPTEPTRRQEALKYRDALRLLSIMIHHMDNKNENQRVVCPPDGVAKDKCVKPAIFFIHDIGASFGVKDDWGKVDYDRWIRDSIWKDPSKCIAQLNHPQLPDDTVHNAKISEEGRKFLSDLLKAFAGGEKGKTRVRTLFLAASMEKRKSSATVEMWTEAFLKKVEEIQFPMGRTNPDFKCPAGPKLGSTNPDNECGDCSHMDASGKYFFTLLPTHIS